MDQLDKLNKAGKKLLVYIDAEFQTFRQPDDDDKLLASGYTKTPYLFGMAGNNYTHSNYHFLLSFGFIVVDKGVATYHLALFPSLFKFKDASGQFVNGQLLEPGYTTCAPGVAAAIATQRTLLKDCAQRFPFFRNLSLGNREIFKQINETYNNSIDDVELWKALSTLNYFFETIVPNALIVHKGQNDMWALKNTAHYYRIGICPTLSRNLDMIEIDLPGLPKRPKLNVAQQWFVNPPAAAATAEAPNAATAAPANAAPNVKPGLHQRIIKLHPAMVALRAKLLTEIQTFFLQKWGAAAANVAAHNPLVDCAYAAILDLGLGPLSDPAISVYYN